jgi:hypothetical protein
MSEKLLRKMVVAALKPLHAISVENGCGIGCPDINLRCGWIELKEMDAWPKRETTVLGIPHFTQEQRVWLTRRCHAGGRAWVLLKVGHEFLLFDGPTACDKLGVSTRAELIQLALLAFLCGFDENVFLDYFKAQSC